MKRSGLLFFFFLCFQTSSFLALGAETEVKSDVKTTEAGVKKKNKKKKTKPENKTEKHTNSKASSPKPQVSFPSKKLAVAGAVGLGVLAGAKMMSGGGKPDKKSGDGDDDEKDKKSGDGDDDEKKEKELTPEEIEAQIKAETAAVEKRKKDEKEAEERRATYKYVMPRDMDNFDKNTVEFYAKDLSSAELYLAVSLSVFQQLVQAGLEQSGSDISGKIKKVSEVRTQFKNNLKAMFDLSSKEEEEPLFVWAGEVGSAVSDRLEGEDSLKAKLPNRIGLYVFLNCLHIFSSFEKAELERWAQKLKGQKIGAVTFEKGPQWLQSEEAVRFLITLNNE